MVSITCMTGEVGANGATLVQVRTFGLTRVSLLRRASICASIDFVNFFDAGLVNLGHHQHVSTAPRSATTKHQNLELTARAVK